MDFIIWGLITLLELFPFVIIGVGVLLVALFLSAIFSGSKGDGPPPGNLGAGNDIPNYGINNFNPGGIGRQYGRNCGRPVPPNPKRNQ